LDLRHDNDISTLRINGRKLLEMREIECHLGVMKNTSGSAMFTIGNTKVVAFVQGPHQVISTHFILQIDHIKIRSDWVGGIIYCY
jgi:ribonuclease PH